MEHVLIQLLLFVVVAAILLWLIEFALQRIPAPPWLKTVLQVIVALVVLLKALSLLQAL